MARRLAQVRCRALAAVALSPQQLLCIFKNDSGKRLLLRGQANLNGAWGVQ